MGHYYGDIIIPDEFGGVIGFLSAKGNKQKQLQDNWGNVLSSA